jgi:flavin-binding protein dodecin
MGYLPSFEHDIFLSYARVDDLKPSGVEKGWVESFQEYLEIALARRFGRLGKVKIWRDTRELGGNTVFDEEIQASINRSALFLALLSPGYLHPECYCPKELEWFHRKAQGEPYGLKIGSRGRCFNLLLDDIPPAEWPPGLAGASGFRFHEAAGDGQLVRLSPPGGELFERQLGLLVNDLEETLRAFEEELQRRVQRPAENGANGGANGGGKSQPTVFLAHAEGGLRSVRRRVADELAREGVTVITNIPPPDAPAEHDAAVRQAVSRAALSVHLLDEAEGEEMPGAAGAFYYQRQAEIGLQHARAQLIWVPKTLDLDGVLDDGHREFLRRLESGDRGAARYSFIRNTPSAEAVKREILDRLKQEAERARLDETPHSALLVPHVKDQLHALDLSRVLVARGVMANIIPDEDSPQQNLTRFQELLGGVSLLVIVFGQVAEEWVRERVNSAIKIAVDRRSPLKLCAVYLAGQEDIGIGGLPDFPPVRAFNKPETLARLWDKFIGK